MRFPYQHYEIPASPVDGSTDLYRPEIPLHLIGESDELFLFGLLDTGADGVVIGRGVAETIGATLDENVRWTLRGLNSRLLEAVLGRIDVEVMDGQESATWRMPIAVVTFDDPQHEDIVLLGQTGFLQFFDMRFLGSQHAVELVPNASFPNAGKSSQHSSMTLGVPLVRPNNPCNGHFTPEKLLDTKNCFRNGPLCEGFDLPAAARILKSCQASQTEVFD